MIKTGTIKVKRIKNEEIIMTIIITIIIIIIIIITTLQSSDIHILTGNEK